MENVGERRNCRTGARRRYASPHHNASGWIDFRLGHNADNRCGEANLLKVRTEWPQLGRLADKHIPALAQCMLGALPKMLEGLQSY
ncbi:MAG: hypothetical protein ACREV7_18355 [Steroidobacteraceae bacterium]